MPGESTVRQVEPPFIHYLHAWAQTLRLSDPSVWSIRLDICRIRSPPGQSLIGVHPFVDLAVDLMHPSFARTESAFHMRMPNPLRADGTVYGLLGPGQASMARSHVTSARSAILVYHQEGSPVPVMSQDLMEAILTPPPFPIWGEICTGLQLPLICTPYGGIVQYRLCRDGSERCHTWVGAPPSRGFTDPRDLVLEVERTGSGELRAFRH